MRLKGFQAREGAAHDRIPFYIANAILGLALGSGSIRREGTGPEASAWQALGLSLKTTVHVAAFRTLVWVRPEIEYFRHPQVRALQCVFRS